jgi:zinc protease
MFSARAHRRVAPLALAVLAACASSPAPTPPPTPSAPAELVPPATASRPTVHERTLANGLRVYLLPDDSAPLVCVQVWVRAGSVDEHEARPGQDHGITGLSHFFEHLMFQGTTRYPDYDRALNPLGGRNNAFTYNDATAYWSYAPAEHLPFLLDLEADRFRHMVVDFVHLEPEREVVKNERRLRVDSDPSEIAEELTIRHTFDSFSYRWGPIGWMSDLDAITLEEAQAYHRRHYRPDNAWLIISGKFELEAIDTLLADTWGQLPTAPAQAPEPLPPLDTWTGVRADHLSREAPTTTLFLSWRAPGVSGADARDYAALELIDWALTAGKSGRVTQRLVLSDTPVATRVSASLMPLRHPYVWLWRVDLVPGRTTREAIDAIDAAIADIARDGLTEGELARAIASLRADMVSSNLSHKDRAESVGFALASTGNPLFLFDRLEMLASITQDDIRRVARERLAPTTRVRMTVVPLARHRAAITALPTIETTAAPFAAALGNAFDLFTAAVDLAAREAEAERESRAIRLLAERGERASAKAETAERQAIATWLETNESGTTRRNARLAKQRTELAAERRALDAARAKLRQDVESLRRRLKANPAQGATLTAIRNRSSKPRRSRASS